MNVKKLTIAFLTGMLLLVICNLFSYWYFVFPQDQAPLALLREELGRPPQEYEGAFAERVIGSLITTDEVTTLLGKGFKSSPTSSVLNGFRENGKMLILYKNFNLADSRVEINITIEDLENTKLRYQIEVGTDYAGSEIVKKESTYPNPPFSRTFSMVSSRGQDGWLKGLSYYEGSIVHVNYVGPVDEEKIELFTELTWVMAKRHVDVYNESLKEISESPLLAGKTHLFRPDLPDPDIDNLH